MKNTPYCFYPFSNSPFILSFQYRKEELILNYLLLRYNKPIFIRLCGELLTRTTESMLALIMIIYVNKMLNGNVIITMLIFGLHHFQTFYLHLLLEELLINMAEKRLCYSDYYYKVLQSVVSFSLNPFLYLHCYMLLMVLAVPYTFQLSVHKLLI